ERFARQKSPEEDRIRHGEHHLELPALPDPHGRPVRPFCRIPRILAPVLRQSLQSVPSGTVLHARTRSRLPSQAGSGAPAHQLTFLRLLADSPNSDPSPRVFLMVPATCLRERGGGRRAFPG